MSDYPMVPMDIKLKDTVEEKRLDYDVDLAEKQYQLERLDSELKRFVNGQIKKIERDRIRLRREISELARQKEMLDTYGKMDIIDVATLNK